MFRVPKGTSDSHFLHVWVPTNFLSLKGCREPHKVEKHCSNEYTLVGRYFWFGQGGAEWLER